MHEILGLKQRVSREAAVEYEQSRSVLAAFVHHSLVGRPDIGRLTNGYALERMVSHFRYHASVVAAVLRLPALEILDRFFSWQYRALRARGFSYDYFPIEFETWRDAAQVHLSDASAKPIADFYNGLIRHHQDFIGLSEQPQHLVLALAADWSEVREAFMMGLITGDYRECRRITQTSLSGGGKVLDFVEQVVEPCLYGIGDLWERDEISVAQEHLASGIVLWVLASVFSPMPKPEPLGKIVLTAAPEELHEIGLHIIADLLTEAGWDVDFLGANTPADDLVQHAVKVQADVVGLSIGIAPSLHLAQRAIEQLKREPKLRDVKIMVGGYLLRQYPQLWRMTGADGWAPCAKEAVALVQKWHAERTPKEAGYS